MNSRGEVEAALMGSEAEIKGETEPDIIGVGTSETELLIRGDAEVDIIGDAEADIIGETEVETRGETKLLLGDIDSLEGRAGEETVSTGDTPVLTAGDTLTPDTLILLATEEIPLLPTGDSPPVTATPTLVRSAGPVPSPAHGNSLAPAVSIAGGDWYNGPSSTGARPFEVFEIEGSRLCPVSCEDVILPGAIVVVTVVVVVWVIV